MNKIYPFSLALFFTGVIYSQEVINNSFGNGFYNVVASDSSYSMKLDARIQSLYTGEWDVNESEGVHNSSSQFLIRRARLKFGGFVMNPKLKYKIELGLTNKDQGQVQEDNNMAPKMILDAVIKWNFYQFCIVGRSNQIARKQRESGFIRKSSVGRQIISK
jgi:hypothetical protein